MIGPNAHALSELLALQNKRGERLLDVIQLCLIVSWVLVVDLFERLASISKISWVDSDLVEAFSDHQRNFGCKVDVRDEWDVVALLQAALLDLVAGLSFAVALHCQTNQLCARIGTLHDLINARLYV